MYLIFSKHSTMLSAPPTVWGHPPLIGKHFAYIEKLQCVDYLERENQCTSSGDNFDVTLVMFLE